MITVSAAGHVLNVQSELVKSRLFVCLFPTTAYHCSEKGVFHKWSRFH
uniref:Uncharacterized protein n=1 Tax=Anguilla anguilla TaxID=7936 RepID=A0A0E9USJ3_ANGAN